MLFQPHFSGNHTRWLVGLLGGLIVFLYGLSSYGEPDVNPPVDLIPLQQLMANEANTPTTPDDHTESPLDDTAIPPETAYLDDPEQPAVYEERLEKQDITDLVQASMTGAKPDPDFANIPDMAMAKKNRYQPLTGLLVIPVVRHGLEKGFGDAANVFAETIATKIQDDHPDTHVYFPTYSRQEFKLLGLGRLYEQLVRAYAKTGTPEHRSLAYLVGRLAGSPPAIERVVFVEADPDFHHLNYSIQPQHILKRLWFDNVPKDARYYVKAQVSAYDTSTPHIRRLWRFRLNLPIKAKYLFNVTPSVYDDTDSLAAFQRASRNFSRASLLAAPSVVTQRDIFSSNSQVAGSIVSQQAIPSGRQAQTSEQQQRMERLLPSR